MPPKNTVRGAGAYPSETAAIPTVVSGGFVSAVNTRSVGAIPQHVAGERWHGSAAG